MAELNPVFTLQGALPFINGEGDVVFETYQNVMSMFTNPQWLNLNATFQDTARKKVAELTKAALLPRHISDLEGDLPIGDTKFETLMAVATAFARPDSANPKAAFNQAPAPPPPLPASAASGLPSILSGLPPLLFGILGPLSGIPERPKFGELGPLAGLAPPAVQAGTGLMPSQVGVGFPAFQVGAGFLPPQVGAAFPAPRARAKVSPGPPSVLGGIPGLPSGNRVPGPPGESKALAPPPLGFPELPPPNAAGSAPPPLGGPDPIVLTPDNINRIQFPTIPTLVAPIPLVKPRTLADNPALSVAFTPHQQAVAQSHSIDLDRVKAGRSIGRGSGAKKPYTARELKVIATDLNIPVSTNKTNLAESIVKKLAAMKISA